jgi:transcriptional repressor NrdR
MKCPFCGEYNNKVVDSRLSKDGMAIRRRRECLGCDRRFTTYEQVEEMAVMIVKKDGRREPFSREKVRAGLQRACEKRNISMNVIDAFLDALEQDLRESGHREIPSHLIGEKVMAKLHGLDGVAYVRFASVYREFKDVNDFVSELKNLLDREEARKSEGEGKNRRANDSGRQTEESPS